MSIAEIGVQPQFTPDENPPETYIPNASAYASVDLHDATPYWAQRFVEDPAAARADWLEQVGSLPIDGIAIDPVAIYLQAFARTRASQAGWRIWRRLRPGKPRQEIMDMLSTSATSLSILSNTVDLDEASVTE